jgi:GTP cyclohydrolase I
MLRQCCLTVAGDAHTERCQAHKPGRAHERAAGHIDVIRGPSRHERLEQIAVALLHALGEDPTRPGLVDTPRRFAAMWREFIEFDPGTLDTSFEQSTSSGLVAVTGMRVWSMCEHHLLPFWADVAIGYRPHRQVLGLSKFARIAQKHAHRLTLQEELVRGIAEEVAELSGTEDVGVIAVGEHLCMTMRGARTPHRMASEAWRGCFDAQMYGESAADRHRTAFHRLVSMATVS